MCKGELYLEEEQEVSQEQSGGNPTFISLSFWFLSVLLCYRFHALSLGSIIAQLLMLQYFSILFLTRWIPVICRDLLGSWVEGVCSAILLTLEQSQCTRSFATVSRECFQILHRAGTKWEPHWCFELVSWPPQAIHSNPIWNKVCFDYTV